MTSKANLILLFIGILFLAALIGQDGALALMTLPFLFYLGGGLLTAPQDVRLRISRQLSRTRAESNDPITHRILIENDGPEIPCLKICENVPPKVRVLDANFVHSFTLPEAEKVTLSYTFAASRGRYEWQSIGFTASDPFRLFEHRYELPAPAQFLVLPHPLLLHRLPVRLSRTLRTVGPNLSRLSGSGIDFWGVREYHPGDSLRWIHWRNAARYPQHFFTKQFEREEMANVGFFLDARLRTVGIQGDETLLESSIQAAASLAKRLLQMGNRVSLLVTGERIWRVFPGTGKQQLARILERLAACEPGKIVSLDSLKYLAMRLFPANSMIIVISPLRPGDLPFFARLRAEGYRVLLVSPNPVEYRASDNPLTPSTSLAVRAARLERTTLLWRIRQIGVDVVDWPVAEPLAVHLGKIPRMVKESLA